MISVRALAEDWDASEAIASGWLERLGVPLLEGLDARFYFSLWELEKKLFLALGGSTETLEDEMRVAASIYSAAEKAAIRARIKALGQALRASDKRKVDKKRKKG